MIRSGRTAGANSLEIPVGDIAWQKLPLNVSLRNLIVSMENEEYRSAGRTTRRLPIRDRQHLLDQGGLGGFGQKRLDG